jgi:hypothetical protein
MANSNESGDTQQQGPPSTGKPPSQLSAAHWAATKAGRAAFRKQFHILRPTRVQSPLLQNSLGEPLTRFFSRAVPSRKWLKAKRVSCIHQLYHFLQLTGVLSHLKAELFATLSDANTYNPLHDATTSIDIPCVRQIQAELLAQITARFVGDSEAEDDVEVGEEEDTSENSVITHSPFTLISD